MYHHNILYWFIVALPIRLADGSLFPFSGRVEIYRNGVWGTVCDKYWNITNSQVVCKQLGYGTPLVDTDLHVPAGKGPILLDNVSCSHNQTSLLACSHNGFENHKNCGHVEDVGVSCLSDRKCYCNFHYKKLQWQLLIVRCH